jgi:hypothetical protein
MESIKEFRARLVEQHARELATTDAFLEMLAGQARQAMASPPDLKPERPTKAERGKSELKGGEPRECAGCGQVFMARRCDQKCCSSRCRTVLARRKAVDLKAMPKRVVSGTPGSAGRATVVKLGGTRAEFDEALRRTIAEGPGEFTVVDLVQACAAAYPALQSKCSMENVRYKLKRWMNEGELAVAGGGSAPSDPTRFKLGKHWIGPGTITKVETKPKGAASKVAREYQVFRSGVHVPREPDVEDTRHTND